MVAADQLERWSAVLERLQRGPEPRGEEFELCREVVAAAPGTSERRTAARTLLEGAMADAATSIADAQEIMRILRAAGCGDLDLAELMPSR